MRTQIREVQGIVTTTKQFQMKRAPITVRLTSDLRGKTLSLAAFDIIQLTIPYEAIRDIVEEKEK